MVARFKYKCDSCGHTKFSATGFANDMPLGESDDEWMFRLIFICEHCNQEVTKVISKMNKEISKQNEELNLSW